MTSVHTKTASLAERIADVVVLNVCELPDYTSPDDQPGLLQCTAEELHDCVLRAFELLTDEERL